MADIKELAGRFSDEVFKKGNLDYLEQAATEDYVCHDPLEGDTDIDGFKKQLRELKAAFPDLRIEPSQLIAEGNFAAMRWHFSGTHQGPYLGAKPTGSRVDAEGMTFLRFENGKIAEEWDQYDALGLLRQVGVIEEEELPSETTPRGEQPQA